MFIYETNRYSDIQYFESLEEYQQYRAKDAVTKDEGQFLPDSVSFIKHETGMVRKYVRHNGARCVCFIFKDEFHKTDQRNKE